MSEVSLNPPNKAGVAIMIQQVNGVEEKVMNGQDVGPEANSFSELDSYPEGRTTPTPESESANFLSRNGSFPSSSSNPDSTSSNPSHSAPANTLAPRAMTGLGPLQGEAQLKSSLATNDRIFLLVVAKEVEAFMLKVRAGECPNVIPSIPVGISSTSAMAAMTASFMIASHVSSTFQRMLVYKLAEWYGLKAVHVPDVAMIVGVVGSFDTRGLALRLSDLAPREDTASAPKIKIMQRSQNASSAGSNSNSSPRPGSAVEDGTSEAGSSKLKTLEEREEAYAKARQRIYGNGDEQEADDSNHAPDATPQVSATTNGHDAGTATTNGFDTAPREPATVAGLRQVDDTFPQYQQTNYDTTYGYRMPQQMPAYGYNQALQQMPQQPSYSGYVNHGQMPQQQYPMANSQYMAPMYGAPSQQSNLYAPQGQWVPVQQGNYMPHMPSNNGMMNMQWVPNAANGQMQVPMQMPQVGHQPMPVIPQGMQYPSYGYPHQHHQQQQNGNYGYLAQPTPIRPPPHPHSSASSSISSRSYHSYHDASRPHSRGSTTSNMSQTSSVRFGAMYPANQGGTYRQNRRKHHGVNGINNPIGEAASDSRSTRGHSPSSSTNGSSHSSRQAGSISLIPPSQHPLPQRPDWAANNVPYHPSPIPLNTPQMHPQGHGQGQGHNPTDFPPLRQHGTGTHAEPMQVERAKMRPLNGTSAWNGQARSLSITSPTIDTLTMSSPRASISASSASVGPTVPVPSTPTALHAQTVNNSLDMTTPQQSHQAQVQVQVGKDSTNRPNTHTGTNGNGKASNSEMDDFPRRPPPINSTQTLYNPSAPTPSRPQSTKPPLPAKINVNEEDMVPGRIPEDVIEAKLAAISLKEGVTIGPPPSKAGKVASYAKIVRRD